MEAARKPSSQFRWYNFDLICFGSVGFAGGGARGLASKSVLPVPPFMRKYGV